MSPILPGKLDVWRGFVSTLLGERHDTYRAAIRDAGLERLRVWHQRLPDGTDATVVLFDGPDRGAFRPPPAPRELVIDERAAMLSA